MRPSEKMRPICVKEKNGLYIKDFALSLALRKRLEVTQTTDLS